MKGVVDTHEWRILTVLQEMPQGGTGKQIANRIRSRFGGSMTSVQVMRRMVELHGRDEVFYRLDPATDKPVRRDGQRVHFANPGDCPLFGE